MDHNINCYSLLAHGSLEVDKNKIFKLPNNIRVVQYTDFEKYLFLNDIVSLSITKNLTCDYTQYKDKNWTSYAAVSNGIIVSNNIIPRVYEPGADIKNMWLSIKNTSDVFKLGMYKSILKYEYKIHKKLTKREKIAKGRKGDAISSTFTSSHTTQNNDVYHYDEIAYEKDIFNYKKYGVSMNITENDTDLENVINTISEYLNKKKPGIIITLHQFSCFEQKYKVSEEFSESESKLEIDDYLTSKMQLVNLNEKAFDHSKYLNKAGGEKGLLYFGLNYDSLKAFVKKNIFFTYFYIEHLIGNDSGKKIINESDAFIKTCFGDSAIPLDVYGQEKEKDKFRLVLGKMDGKIVCCSLLKIIESPKRIYYINNICVNKDLLDFTETMFQYIAKNIHDKETAIYIDIPPFCVSKADVKMCKKENPIFQMYSDIGFSFLIGTKILIRKTKNSVKAIMPVIINSKTYKKGKIEYNVCEIKDTNAIFEKEDRDMVGSEFKITTEDIISSIDKNLVGGIKMESTSDIILNINTIDIATQSYFKKKSHRTYKKTNISNAVDIKKNKSMKEMVGKRKKMREDIILKNRDEKMEISGSSS